MTRSREGLLACALLLVLVSCGRDYYDQVVVKRVEELRSGDEEARAHAAWTLGQLGEKAKPAVPALATALEDGSADVRLAAAQALADLGADSAPAVPALMRALEDQDANVRSKAAEALGQIGEPAVPAVPALLASLRDEDALVRANGAWALGELASSEPGSKEAEDALVAAMADVDERVRTWSAEALLKVRGLKERGE